MSDLVEMLQAASRDDRLVDGMLYRKAVDEIERLRRVEQHCDTIRAAAANLIAYLELGGDYREMLSKLKAALEEPNA